MVGINRSGGGGGGAPRIRIVSSGLIARPQVGDVLSIVLGRNIEAAGYSFMIDRGAGYVTLSSSTPYTLQAADIPAPGSTRWPIIARALDLTLVSDPFYSQNPLTPITTFNSAAIGGDSIDAYGDFALSGTTGGQTSLSHIGVINDLERLAGRPGFDIISFHAVGGTTAQTCLSVQVPAIIASPARIAIIHTGVNSYNDSISGGPFTQAQNIAAVCSIIDALCAAKDLVYIDAIHPVSQTGTTGAKARSGEFQGHNAAVRDYCATKSNARYLDSYSIFVDTGSGVNNPLPNLIQALDGIHQTTWGARTWGEGIRATMMASVTLIPWRTQGANLLLPYGTTGGSATAGTGSIIGAANIPLGYNLQIVNGSAAVTVTAVGDVVTLGVSNPGGTSSVIYLQYSQTAALFAQVSPGDVVQCGMDFAVTGAVNLTRIAVTQRENGGNPLWNAMARDAALETAGVFKYNQADQSGRRWTHPRTLPPTVTGMEFIQIIAVDPAATVTVALSNPIFKKLT